MFKIFFHQPMNRNLHYHSQETNYRDPVIYFANIDAIKKDTIKFIYDFFDSRKCGDGEDVRNLSASLLICSACDEDNINDQLLAFLKIVCMPGYSNDQKKEILSRIVNTSDLPFTMSQDFQSAMINDDINNSGMNHIKAKLNDISNNVNLCMELEDLNLNGQHLLEADYHVYAENIKVDEKMLPGIFPHMLVQYICPMAIFYLLIPY